MKTALLLLLFCLAEADEVHWEEGQHADIASRLSANETMMEEFQTRLNKSDKLVEELQQYKAANYNLTLENTQLKLDYYNLTLENDLLTLENSQLKSAVKQLKIAVKSCPSGWKTFGGRCYYRTVSWTTWQESRDYCLIQGADLVVINSSEEKVFIKGLSSSTHRSWIGLTRTEGRWTWVDGTPLTTQYWVWGQPINHGDYNCAAYDHWTLTGVLFNRLCSDKRASICEK